MYVVDIIIETTVYPLRAFPSETSRVYMQHASRFLQTDIEPA